MTDLQALYAGICAQPDEDTPRLALADWLDEEGGKPNPFRADLIRTHVQMAREEPWSKPWRELRDRWFALSGKVTQQDQKGKLPWLLHLKGRVKAWAFERGLVGHLTLFSKRFVEEGESYFEQDPIRSVKFVKLTSTLGTVKPEVLFNSPYMGRIVKLDLDGSGLKDADLQRLAKSRCAPILRSITLSGDNPFSAGALPKLLKAMPSLTELNLLGNSGFGDNHAQALAKCPEFARVAVLDVSCTTLTADGVVELINGKFAPQLTVLKLTPVMVVFDAERTDGSYYRTLSDRAGGVKVAEALAGAKSLTKLRELDLSYRDIGDQGLKALIKAAESFPALRDLNLDSCGLTLPAVKELAESELGGRLLHVSFRYNANLVRHAAKLKEMFPEAHVEEPDDL